MLCCLVVLLSRFLAPLLCRETCFFGDNPLSFCDVALSLGVLTRCLCHCSPVFGVLLCDIHGGVPPPCVYPTVPRGPLRCERTCQGMDNSLSNSNFDCRRGSRLSIDTAFAKVEISQAPRRQP